MPLLLHQRVSLMSTVRTRHESVMIYLLINIPTDDTVYRVGSISKLLFLYTFLVEVGHDYWHRSITDFVPELVEAARSCSAESDPLTCPDWDDITLGALASHLAGIGRGRPVLPADTEVNDIPITAFGLPSKPLIELAQCESQPCTRAEALRAFLQESPVEAVFGTPFYSNGGYQILTYALEAITNRSISDMITNDVFCPLGMDDSSYTLANNSRGIIPGSLEDSLWPAPLGDAGATGGMYSSSRDLVKLGQSILNNTQLSPASTRRWLKPWAHTAVWQQAMGLAWEITRWPVDDRIVDVYTKQGDFGAYRSSMSERSISVADQTHRSLSLSLRHHPRLRSRRPGPHSRHGRSSSANGALRDRPQRSPSRPRRHSAFPSRIKPCRHLHFFRRCQHNHHPRDAAFPPRPQNHLFHLQLVRCSEHTSCQQIPQPGRTPLPYGACSQDGRRHGGQEV